jgi:hypothetical protein
MTITVLPFSFIFLVFVFGCHIQKLAFFKKHCTQQAMHKDGGQGQ